MVEADLTTAPEVILVDGDSASGMATMLADLLASNLRDFGSRRRTAAVARGRVVMTASDRDVSVTLTFRPGAVEIRDGADPKAPVVAAPWLTMAKICSGLTSPQAAWREGDLKVQRLTKSPVATAAASFVLSVPAAFYEDAESGGISTPSVRERVGDRRVLIVVAALGTLAVIWMMRRR